MQTVHLLWSVERSVSQKCEFVNVGKPIQRVQLFEKKKTGER